MGIFDPNVTQDTTTATSVTTPWSQQQPYLTFGFDQADQLYRRGGPRYYRGDTYTPFAPQQEAAMGMVRDRAMAGSPVNMAAQNQITGTLNGDFLNSNPYLDQTFDRAAGAVRRGIDSQFASGGRYGSGAHQDIMGENLSGLANQIYGGNYQAERGRQAAMVPYSPMIANQDYYDASQLMGVGNMVQGQADKVLQADINRWNYNQNKPYANLENYMRNIQGNYGGQTNSTQTQPLYSNSTAQNLLGAGLVGAGLLSNADAIGNGFSTIAGWF